ncbi:MULTISPECIES: putative manganese-dependent inorganic diphosphatase [unclassified Thomasclavelia]|uniref:putative manganese-dependent inorganic diphosphatase n=1 Tax=unclassified Thomasclavelia TaxID=3025756 RepID=UPI000B39D8ED|nr:MULTISPECIES: putative manganese-dependent inorganic diphosphatase [unclassified Thomasclavelia]OUP76868.1 manganese-dependent inorganic pyrophosphatase [Erysipelatoclostridium sp. An173]OUQ07645.1 manganese-dependent inorganic pyrophosphatase [Erysipelatoclostridium sp. An15]
MKEVVYVSGHRNPDTDSICSAIAYSYLLKAINRYNAMPVRLGKVNRETEYVLKRFDVEIPVLLKTVKQKVEDLNYDKVTVFSKELTLKTAWDLMKQQNVKSAPILDDHGQLLGLLSTSNIVEGFMEKWDSSLLKDAHTPIENVIDTLEASILYLNHDLKIISGDLHIAAMRGEEAKKRIKPGDIVIVGGDRDDAVNSLIEAQVSLIILTGSLELEKDMLDKLKDKGISVISTPFNTYLTSQQIIQAIPVEYIMQKGDLKIFTTDDTLDHVKEVMSETRFRSYPVLDLNNRCVGSISRFALLKGLRKKVILVDHNERGQSIPGIEEADILEIVDHHRVADIQTVGPLLFRGEPLGSTATIVTKMFEEFDVEIPQAIAGILLGAVVSDTLLFKSPTCTPTDTKIARKLAKIAQVDIQEFAMDMFKAGTSLAGKTVEEIFNQDFKKFLFENGTVGVGQVNTMDIEGFAEYKAEMLEYMTKFAQDNNLDFVALLLTDVINANSEIFAAGPKAYLVEQAFNIKLNDSQATLKGVISRKKQVVPAITAVMSD